MAAPLSITCSLSSNVVPASGGPRLVYLLVEVGGGENSQALPSNLGFVIDTSDSMRIRLVTDQQFAELVRSGQAQEVMTDGVPAYQISSISSETMSRLPRRIDYAAQALLIANEYLRPVDQFSLVAFAARAYCMIPSISGRERYRLQQSARELEYLRLGEATHMSEGMAMSLAEIQRQPSRQYAGRMVLLTDGHTLNVNDCYEYARQARQAGIKITTMGIGAEFNEDLLIPLADMTGGNAYYIETPDQLPDAFRKELGSALSISYRNVEVKLQLTRGVELRRVHRVLPELSVFDQGPDLGGSYALLIGDYDPGMPVALLLELVLPPWPEGNYRLAQVLLTWDDPDGMQETVDKVSGNGSRVNLRQDVIVNMAKQATARLDSHVMSIVERVGAYKMGTQALEVAQEASLSEDQTAKDAATVRLRQAATRLLDMGETVLGNAMLQQAETLAQSGNLDPEATKRLRYETRRLTQHP